MKKILALTSIRSDYDLMSPVYRLLHDDPTVDFRLLVGGAHLSDTYGRTVQHIEADGFTILARIESLAPKDNRAARITSLSNLLAASIKAVDDFSPDLIIYAGDREEVMIGALLGSYLSIPTLHFFGGDHAKDGHIDNPLRHGASKLSTVHFVSIEEHKKRLRAIGEPDHRIHVIGSVALDKFVQHAPAPMMEIYKQLGIAPERQKKEHALLIFHPIEEEIGHAEQIVRDMVEALLQQGLFVFISTPNSDHGNGDIRRAIEKVGQQAQVHVYKNLPRDTFLSIFKQAKLLIGNSSAGITEAASVPLTVVNVGLRQRGRLADKNVFFCDADRKNVENAVSKALSADIASLRNRYGDGKSAPKAYQLIKKIDFRALIKKTEDPLEEP